MIKVARLSPSGSTDAFALKPYERADVPVSNVSINAFSSTYVTTWRSLAHRNAAANTSSVELLNVFSFGFAPSDNGKTSAIRRMPTDLSICGSPPTSNRDICRTVFVAVKRYQTDSDRNTG